MKGHDIYLAGESYAGMYIPHLLHEIDQHNEENKEDEEVFKPNLKGMLVINGVTNYKYDIYPGMIETAYSHFLIDEEFYNEFKSVDCDWTYPTHSDEFRSQLNYHRCIHMVVRLQHKYEGINIYDIYGKCWAKDPEDPEYITELVGTTNVGGKNMYYKAYSTAEDITPWLFVDKAELQDSMYEGHLAPDAYEESLASLYKY